jgi:hypothetical protein
MRSRGACASERGARTSARGNHGARAETRARERVRARGTGGARTRHLKNLEGAFFARPRDLFPLRQRDSKAARTSERARAPCGRTRRGGLVRTAERADSNARRRARAGGECAMRRRTRRLDIIFLPKIQSDDFALSAGCPRDRCHGGSGAIRRRWRAGEENVRDTFRVFGYLPAGPHPARQFRRRGAVTRPAIRAIRGLNARATRQRRRNHGLASRDERR